MDLVYIPPVSRLPAEILCQIFRLLIKTYNNPKQLPVLTVSYLKLIASVCRRWNDAVADNSIFWRKIIVRTR